MTERKLKSEQKTSTPYRVTICGKHIRKGVSCDEETSGACHNETSQDFEKATGASERQAREGNKMLSYRRETALQGALQFSQKVEDWNWETIFYGHYRSIFNHNRPENLSNSVEKNAK